MERTRVRSSNLASVGYDETNETLEIEFNNGGVYLYLDVPSSVYAGLMSASSHGAYFDSNIKKAGYRFRKIS